MKQEHVDKCTKAKRVHASYAGLVFHLKIGYRYNETKAGKIVSVWSNNKDIQPSEGKGVTY